MHPIEMAIALLGSLAPERLAAEPPDVRHRLAVVCRRLAQIAESPALSEAPSDAQYTSTSSGILAQLRDGACRYE